MKYIRFSGPFPFVRVHHPPPQLVSHCPWTIIFPQAGGQFLFPRLCILFGSPPAFAMALIKCTPYRQFGRTTTPATIYSVRLGEILLRGNGEQPQLGGSPKDYSLGCGDKCGALTEPLKWFFVGKLFIGLTRSDWYNTFARIPMDFSKFWSDIPLIFELKKNAQNRRVSHDFQNRKDPTKKLLPKKRSVRWHLSVLKSSSFGTPRKSPQPWSLFESSLLPAQSSCQDKDSFHESLTQKDPHDPQLMWDAATSCWCFTPFFPHCHHVKRLKQPKKATVENVPCNSHPSHQVLETSQNCNSATQIQLW